MPVLKPIRPLTINELSPKTMEILWNDGLRTEHAYRRLRYLCHCAQCRDEHSGKRLIQLEQVAEDVHPKAIHPVGTYAIRFDWSDGHGMGIYAYEMLRAEGAGEG
jgi:DUF971 family protein